MTSVDLRMAPTYEIKVRNKFSLSETDIEQMKSMTPKEKKKFLREFSNATKECSRPTSIPEEETHGA